MSLQKEIDTELFDSNFVYMVIGFQPEVSNSHSDIRRTFSCLMEDILMVGS